jgi:DNA-binding transcriptional regulator YbjK
VPPPNPSRRRALTDAAIELVAHQGLHGLTHRALDGQAGVPAGTASNYFSTRDALLVATMQRVWALHHEDMERQSDAVGATRRPGRRGTLADAVELIAGSLVHAATTQRDRYVTIFEMQSEMRRRPELAAALVELQTSSAGQTSAYHAARRLPIRPDAVPSLEILYGGALLALVSMPAERVTLARARPLAHAMIYGVSRRA